MKVTLLNTHNSFSHYKYAFDSLSPVLSITGGGRGIPAAPHSSLQGCESLSRLRHFLRGDNCNLCSESVGGAAFGVLNHPWDAMAEGWGEVGVCVFGVEGPGSPGSP